MMTSIFVFNFFNEVVYLTDNLFFLDFQKHFLIYIKIFIRIQQ